MTDAKITMLGTGHATVTKCYNTCFVLEAVGRRLLVDGGGGSGILAQLEKADISIASIHDMFITHAHTDHIFGAVWIVRMVLHMMKDGLYEGHLRIYSHDRVLNVLREICRLTLSDEDFRRLGKSIKLCELKDGETFSVGHMFIQCFNIHSIKEKQFGFRAQLPFGVPPETFKL